MNRPRRWKCKEISYGEFLVAAIHVSARAAGHGSVTSLDCVGRSSGDSNEGSDGENGEEAGEHV